MLFNRMPSRPNIETHDLIRSPTDPDAIYGLATCRRCQGKEKELEDQSCFERLLCTATARELAQSPLERAIAQLEQRRFWVGREMRMNDDGSPNGLTAEQANQRLREIAPEFVVLDELKRLLEKAKPSTQFGRLGGHGTIEP